MRYFGTKPKILFVVLAAAGANAQFAADPGPLATGSMPRSVAAVDLNGDGKPDIVTANYAGNNITVLLGDGSGGFAAAAGSPIAAGTNPQSIAIGDFNGDGKLDIVTANSGGNSITVLLGDGSGGFTAAGGSPILVGALPIFVAAGDFNGDGKADIVTANSGDNTITVLLGNGSGGFTPAPGSPVAVGAFPQSVAVGDFNGDGNADIVTANSGDNTVTVLLGDGSGGFRAALSGPVAVGISPVSVALGDLNGDGKLDMVTANAGDNTVTALLGDGTGGFTAATHGRFTVGTQPWSVAVGDFNGDGDPDIVTADFSGNSITVLLGDGTGGFSAATGSPFAAGTAPISVAVGDFNGDGKPDIATANLSGSTVTVLLNTRPAIAVNSPAPAFDGGAEQAAAGVDAGTIRYRAPNSFDAGTAATSGVAAPSGTLQSAIGSPFAVGASPQSVAVGDFNGDGNADLVTANYADNNVTVLLGDGAGGFAPAPGSPFAAGANPASVAVADFNGDGNPDIATANSGGNNVTILLGNGSGGFTPAPGSPYTVGTEPLSMAVGDFNADGREDLATANYGVDGLTVLLSGGSGGFTAATSSPFPMGSFPQCVAVADFNGDGKADLAMATSGNYVTVLLGNGRGGFTVAGTFPAGSFPQSVAVADVNGDGKPDIVTASFGDNTVTVLLGNGSGGFTADAGSPFAVGSSPRSVAVVDVNGDGRPDIVTANVLGNTVTVLLGNGSGGFSAAAGSPFAAGTTPFSVAAGDFNGDGRVDLAIANAHGGTVTVLLGMPATTSSVLSTKAGSAIVYGTSVPLALTVTQPSGGFNAPTGSGTFLDGGSAIGSATQTGSTYAFSAAGLSAGSHTLTAAYSGDSANAPSISNAVALTVTQASQTITFGALVNRKFGSAPFTVGATASSGFSVAFVSITSSVCAVSGTTVTLVAAGNCTIEASQAGDSNYSAAAAVDQNLTVTQASQTITFASLPTMAFGAPFTVGATASSGLAVSFTSSSLPVCTVAGATVTLASPGRCTIEATQPGNASYTGAAPVDQSFTVTQGSQTITFGALQNTALGTPPFTVYATASSGLVVSFTSSTSSVCTVAATTVTLLSLGTCRIAASQTGNADYSAAAPVSQSLNVTPASQTITFGALSDQAYGATPFQVSATATSGLAVAFTSTTSGVCTVSGSTVTLKGAGTCAIQAAQAGNTSYAAAAPVIQSFQVAQQSQTITFGALSNQTFGTTTFTVSATSSSGLAVTFASTTSYVCAVAGATVTLVGTGNCTIEASQTGNTKYSSAMPVDQNFTIAQASQTITFGTLANKALGTPPLTVSATASSGLAVSFTSNSGICTVSGATVTLALGGTCTIRASQPGNTNYAAATPVDQSFTVTPSSQTITFANIQNLAFGIAPFALSATASSGLAVSFTSTTLPVCTVFGGMVTLVSVGGCSIQAAQAGDTNYAAATPVVRKFTVSVGAVSIGSVLNAGSYAATPIASDSYAVAFGMNFSTATAQNKSLTLPVTLAGATVNIADSKGVTKAAPLYYVSPAQINFVVPEGLANGSATVTVANSGNSGSFATTIASVSPSLFTADSSGSGVPAALALIYGSGSPQVLPVFNCTGTPAVCTTVPIDLGPPATSVYLALFGTGIRGRTGLSGVSVTLGGKSLKVTYAGAQSTYPGLDQVNVLLDRSLIGKGSLPLQLTVDGVPANAVVVDVM